MKKRGCFVVLFVAIALVWVMGCGNHTKDGKEKIKDIVFTVLGEENIPDELLNIIDDKKEKEFKITFRDSDFLYIGVGYGSQDTGGYSITVNALYETPNAVYLDTNLIGPGAENRQLYKEQKKESISYPYVVLKTEYLEKSVVFD